MSKTAASTSPADQATVISKVVLKTAQGVEVEASVLRFSLQAVAFMVHGPPVALRLSEILPEFSLWAAGRQVYHGPATVTGLISTGTGTACEAVLRENGFDLPSMRTEKVPSWLPSAYNDFLASWQNYHYIGVDYKLLTADLQFFLENLRLWIDRIELGVRRAPEGERSAIERRLAEELCRLITPALDSLFEKFETLAGQVEERRRSVHLAYIQKLVQPLLLASPFACRSIQKPLGYSGDYGIVNMILGDPHEGSTLYGKVLNRWFIQQPPAEAHRNRVRWLTERLRDETSRVASSRRPAQIYNLGCGPAKEVQEFLGECQWSNRAAFTLVDFSEETLEYAKSVLETVKQQFHRSTRIDYVRKSVAQLLKTRERKGDQPGPKYDFVYCAGLFDYLADPVCKQLLNLLYEMLAPGGLLVATNVDSANPIRHWLGDILDWHLIYRSGREFFDLRPERAAPDEVRVFSEITGVNIFLEVRKPVLA